MRSTRYPNEERFEPSGITVTLEGCTYMLKSFGYQPDSNEHIVYYLSIEPNGNISYAAQGIRTDERPDADGYQTLYELTWLNGPRDFASREPTFDTVIDSVVLE